MLRNFIWVCLRKDEAHLKKLDLIVAEKGGYRVCMTKYFDNLETRSGDERTRDLSVQLPSQIKNAKENSKLNNISNIHFIHGNVDSINNSKFDIICGFLVVFNFFLFKII